MNAVVAAFEVGVFPQQVGVPAEHVLFGSLSSLKSITIFEVPFQANGVEKTKGLLPTIGVYDGEV